MSNPHCVCFQTCPRGGNSYYDWYCDRDSRYCTQRTCHDCQPQHQLPQVEYISVYMDYYIFKYFNVCHTAELMFAVVLIKYLPKCKCQFVSIMRDNFLEHPLFSVISWCYFFGLISVLGTLNVLCACVTFFVNVGHILLSTGCTGLFSTSHTSVTKPVGVMLWFNAQIWLLSSTVSLL